jgi:predicted acylesterase/phospholipase RssA
MGIENHSLLRDGYLKDGKKMYCEFKFMIRGCVMEYLKSNELILDDPCYELSCALENNTDYHITFEHLKILRDFDPKRFKDLIVVAVHAHEQCDPVAFSYENTPSVEIAQAVRASISIPLYLKPWKIEGCEQEWPGVFIDGGVKCCVPTRWFPKGEEKNTLVFTYGNHHDVKNDVFCRLFDEVVPGDQIWKQCAFSNWALRKLLVKLGKMPKDININASFNENMQELRDNYMGRVIRLNVGDVTAFDFTKAHERYRVNKLRGYFATRRHLMKFNIVDFPHSQMISYRRFFSLVLDYAVDVCQVKPDSLRGKRLMRLADGSPYPGRALKNDGSVDVHMILLYGLMVVFESDDDNDHKKRKSKMRLKFHKSKLPDGSEFALALNDPTRPLFVGNAFRDVLNPSVPHGPLVRVEDLQKFYADQGGYYGRQISAWERKSSPGMSTSTTDSSCSQRN